MGRFSMTICVPKFEKSIKKNPEKIQDCFLKKSGHQYRFKISLRIEWEHSQPLKFTLKHSNLHPMNLYQERTSFGRLNKTNATWITICFFAIAHLVAAPSVS